MDISKILERKGYEGWEVVDRGNGAKITKWPDGVKQPTEKQLAEWWVEIEAEIKDEQIKREREQRYQQETDGLLFDALAKMNAPELEEWKQAREQINQALPFDKKESR